MFLKSMYNKRNIRGTLLTKSDKMELQSSEWPQ